ERRTPRPVKSQSVALHFVRSKTLSCLRITGEMRPCPPNRRVVFPQSRRVIPGAPNAARRRPALVTQAYADFALQSLFWYELFKRWAVDGTKKQRPPVMTQQSAAVQQKSKHRLPHCVIVYRRRI